MNLSYRVETLWQFALRRLTIAEREARRDICLWGQAKAESRTDDSTPVSRSEIERKLNDPEGAVQRLRRVMDAWNALWFWPLTDILTNGATPPSLDEWIEGLTTLLGRHFEAKRTGRTAGGETLGLPTGWEELGTAEELDLGYAGAQSVAEVVATTPWLRATERIATQQGFFHWELDFATVFQRFGFDLQVGNPPWVRPRSDVDALLAEGDPWWQLAVKPTQERIAYMRAKTLELDGIVELVIDGTVDLAATATFVGAPQNYPHLAGLQPDLYRCFMEQTWRHGGARGTIGMIHPEAHFTDEKAGVLRQASYERLRRHWQFVNELSLFEIHHLISYGVHIYGPSREVKFEMATSLYRPETVLGSLHHDGSGDEPGLKDPEGHWDLRAHSGRITEVTDETLATWHAVLEEDAVPLRQTRMVYAVNRATSEALRKLSLGPRMGQLQLEFSSGWHEKSDRKRGLLDVSWGPSDSWQDAILQGPNLFVANPFFKSPNPTMLHNQDWAPVDLEALPGDVLPITAFKPAKPPATYSAAYTHWGFERVPARDHFRIAWRVMVNTTNQRTLISALIPPGAAHVHAVSSIGIANSDEFFGAAGALASLVNDFVVRATAPSTLGRGVLRGLMRLSSDSAALPFVSLRVLRLNAMTGAYTDLWKLGYSTQYHDDSWGGGLNYSGRPDIGDVAENWSPTVPLRRDSDRRQALLELDAITAIEFGLTADELCAIYRTQFSVLHGYDRHRYFYDAVGRLIPSSVLSAWKQKGPEITVDERTATHPGSGIDYVYELPFRTLDREADMRQAYAHFERILQERSCPS